MKKILLLTPVVVVIMAIVAAMNFSDATAGNSSPDLQEEMAIDFPEDVMIVLEHSCFDCHSDEANNFKAKGKLNFSKWDEYSASKKISKLDAICEEVKDESMPKKSYVKKYPEKALSHENIDLICNWAADESKKIMGE